MRYLYALIICLLIGNALYAQNKFQLGLKSGPAIATYSGNDIVKTTTSVEFSIGFFALFDYSRMQYGFGLDIMGGGNGAEAIYSTRIANGDTLSKRMAVSEFAYATPHVFVNYKFLKRDWGYAYGGGSIGWPLIPSGYDFFRAGAELGFVVQVFDFFHVSLSESWRGFSYSDGNYFDNNYNHHYGTDSYYINSLTTNVSLRFVFSKKNDG